MTAVRKELAWPATLAFATLAGTVIFSCLMPFATIATFCAATMRRSTGLVTVIASWIANQMLGFGLLGYARDAMTVANGVSLLVAAMAAFGLAGLITRGRVSIMLLLAMPIAFAAFQLVLLVYATAKGDLTMFTPDIVALVGMNEAIWFVGLMAQWILLRRIAPSWIGASNPAET